METSRSVQFNRAFFDVAHSVCSERQSWTIVRGTCKKSFNEGRPRYTTLHFRAPLIFAIFAIENFENLKGAWTFSLTNDTSWREMQNSWSVVVASSRTISRVKLKGPKVLLTTPKPQADCSGSVGPCLATYQVKGLLEERTLILSKLIKWPSNVYARQTSKSLSEPVMLTAVMLCFLTRSCAIIWSGFLLYHSSST